MKQFGYLFIIRIYICIILVNTWASWPVLFYTVIQVLYFEESFASMYFPTSLYPVVRHEHRFTMIKDWLSFSTLCLSSNCQRLSHNHEGIDPWSILWPTFYLLSLTCCLRKCFLCRDGITWRTSFCNSLVSSLSLTNQICLHRALWSAALDRYHFIRHLSEE